MPRSRIRPTERRQTLSRWLPVGNLVFATLFVALGQPTPASAQPLPPNTYQLSLHSQPGDPWSRTTGKSDWLYHASDGQFFCQGFDWIGDGSLNHLTFTFRGNNGDLWQIAFTVSQELTPGNYEGTQRIGYPRLDVNGLGGGCLTATGKFTVLDVAYQGSGNFIHVTRFAATFEFHCYGLPPALTGAMYFNSNGFPPPPTLLMKPRPPMPDAKVGNGYSQKVDAEGGTPPYLWAINAGRLPPGLSLDADGVISGEPTAPGKYTFTIAAIDSAPWVNGYPSQVVTSDFSITVNPAGFSIEDGLPPTATKGIGYAYQFGAIGGLPPYEWSLIEGQLPTGLSLGNDAKLSGIPSSPGIFTFTLRASDAAEHQSERKYAIKVIDPPRIANAKYKANKRKLVITGEKFDATAVLFIDGQEVKPKSHDSESFVVKALSLTTGSHDLRVVNPDGGTASVTIAVE